MNKLMVILLKAISSVIDKKELNEVEKQEIKDNIEELITFSKAHSVENILYYATINLDLGHYTNILNNIHKKIILKETTQEMEKLSLSQTFKENKMKYMFLKGSILKYFYPSPDMRQMADLDILLDIKQRKMVKKIMKSQGYKLVMLDKDHHDVYHKLPFMNVEIHYHTINDKYNIDMYDKSEDYLYEMNNEDFYTYIIYHMYKHFNRAGTGIRSIIDLYLYDRKINDSINNEILNEKLNEHNLKDFKDQMLRVAFDWFGKVDIIMKKVSNYIASSGTYGNQENYMKYNLINQNKRIYFFRRLFPKVSSMKENFPILKKCIILLPFCYIYRLFRGLLHFNKSKNELKMLRSINNEEVNELEKIKKGEEQ